jgi:hypothetical protein
MQPFGLFIVLRKVMAIGTVFLSFVCLAAAEVGASDRELVDKIEMIVLDFECTFFVLFVL